MAIRVFVPDKREAVLNEVLKELYLLRQAIDYQSGTADSRLKMVDKIRSKLRTLIEKEDSQQ
tara:strand:+ start:144 stop:329 length:186 start_codon:yes stop_codon:yes gene_type:complete